MSQDFEHAANAQSQVVGAQAELAPQRPNSTHLSAASVLQDRLSESDATPGHVTIRAVGAPKDLRHAKPKPKALDDEDPQRVKGFGQHAMVQKDHGYYVMMDGAHVEEGGWTELGKAKAVLGMRENNQPGPIQHAVNVFVHGEGTGKGRPSLGVEMPRDDGDTWLALPSDLAEVIRTQTDWKPGQPIVLFSCSTGLGKASVGQALANILGVTVMAPTIDIQFIEVTYSKLPADHWKTFTPQ